MLLVFRPRFRLFLFGTIFVDLRRYFSNFPEYLGTPYGHSQWLYVQHAGTPKSYMRYSFCYCRNSELLHMNLDNDKIHYHNGVEGQREQRELKQSVFQEPRIVREGKSGRLR